MFGIRLSFLRCQAGLTQSELGARLNLTASALGMYEQGRRMPSLSIISEIADEFGVSCDFLLCGRCQSEREATMELMVTMLSALSYRNNNTREKERNRTSKRSRKRVIPIAGPGQRLAPVNPAAAEQE